MPRRSGLALSLHVRLFICLTLLTILGSDTVQAQAPPPPLSDNLLNTPGPSGGARLGDFYYIYARNPTTNQVQVRKTNGVPSEGSGTSWTTLPALATDCYPTAAPVCSNVKVPIPQKISVIARRMSDGQLMVTQTTTGNSGFLAWKEIPGGIGGVPGNVPGTKTDVSPSAVWYRPTLKTGTVDTAHGGVVVYYSNLRDGSLYMTSSSDGYNTWTTPEALPGGSLASGPTAVVDIDPFSSSWLYRVRVEFKTGDASTLPDFNKQKIITDYDMIPGSVMGVGYTDYPMKSPANRKDPAIVSTVGTCIIEKDPTVWARFHIPEVKKMRASVMKFHLSYNGTAGAPLPTWSEVDYSQIKDCVAAGAKTIILRTAETPLDAAQMTHFMSGMKFFDQPSKSVSSLAGDQAFAGVRLIIENGNEPDHVYTGLNTTLDPLVARDKALSGITVKSSYPSFKFIVSMPIDKRSDHLFDYSKKFVSPNGAGKKVLDEYDGAACHVYSEANLNWNNTAEEPLGSLYFTLARLPYGKFIHMSEVGLNSRTLNWAAKGPLYRSAMFAAPSVVEGWEFFCLSAHPRWNLLTHYCIDKLYTEASVTGARASIPDFGEEAGFTLFTLNNPAGRVYKAGMPVGFQGVVVKGSGNSLIPFDHESVITEPVGGMNPAGSTGYFWIKKNTGATGIQLPVGYVDLYDLLPEAGAPCATALGNR